VKANANIGEAIIKFSETMNTEINFKYGSNLDLFSSSNLLGEYNKNITKQPPVNIRAILSLICIMGIIANNKAENTAHAVYFNISSFI